MKNDGFTLRKRLRSFRYAFNGIRLLIRHEHNAWIHCLAAVCAVTAGWLTGLSAAEWIAIAFEALADVVSPDYNEGIKRTKDLAAGAVLLLAMTAAVVGLIIFIPKLL